MAATALAAVVVAGRFSRIDSHGAQSTGTGGLLALAVAVATDQFSRASACQGRFSKMALMVGMIAIVVAVSLWM